MRNNKWLLLAALVLVAGFVMTACAAQEIVVTVEVPGETITVEVPAEGVPAEEPAADAIEYTFQDKPYRVGIFSDITTTNYFGANGPDNTVWNSYVLPARPAAYALSEVTFQFVPSLATDFPAPLTEEGDFWVTTVTFDPAYTWSDGTPVTPADWAYTVETVKRFGLISGNWATWCDFNYIDRIEAVDDTTAKLYFSTKPGLARYEYGVPGAPILPSHFWAPLTDPIATPETPAEDASEEDQAAYLAEIATAQDQLFAIDPAGEPQAGPWVFGNWEPGAFAENSANTSYADTGTVVTYYANGAYAETNAAGETFTAYGDASGDVSLEFAVGPFVSSAFYTIYGTQDAAILALKDGEVDFVLNSLGLQRGLIDQVVGDPNLTVIENGTNGFRYMSFNTHRAPMSDVAFRQAVATLIDKEFVTSTILQGVAFPIYSFVPEANAAWYFDDVPRFGFNEDGTAMDREARLNTAVQILKDAGCTWTGNEPAWDADNRAAIQDVGTLNNPDGSPVAELELLAPSPGYDPLRSTFAIWIETWLREAGIPITANLTGFNVIADRVFTQQDFDMYILGWSLSIFPDFPYEFFREDQAVLDGNNAGGYYNEEFEALGQQLLSCEGVETCKEIANQMQLILSTEVPYVVLFDTGIIEVYNSANVTYPYTTTLPGLQFGGHSASDNVAVR